MAKYTIAVEWIMHDFIEVDADSLQSAIQKAQEHDELPNGDYLDGSFEVNVEITRELNKTKFS